MSLPSLLRRFLVPHRISVVPSRFSGHSKWSKIKHRKATADMTKSKATSKITKEISSAVRDSGRDPETNIRLASILSRARDYGIPKSTVERAIISGAAPSSDGSEHMMLEGRGASGYLLLIEAVTGNKQRTRPEIRSLLAKHGAVLGEPGSISYLFDRKVTTEVREDNEIEPLDVAIEVGAEDVKDSELEDGTKILQFICEPSEMRSVSAGIKKHDMEIKTATVEYLAQSTAKLSDTQLEQAAKLIRIIGSHDDVVRIHDNIEPADPQSSQ